MPIRVDCKYCGKQFSAWDDLKGKQVECPKCHQRMVVPKSPAGQSDPSAKKARPEAPKPTATSTARVTEPRKSNRTPVSVTRRPARKPATSVSTDAPKSSAGPKSKSSPASRDEFDDSDALPIVCPNCRAPSAIDEDLCDACGFHKILGKVIDLDGVVRRNSATGLERVVRKQLAGDETPSSALLWFKILAAFMLVTICMACLGVWWWIGVAVLAGGYAAFHFRSKAADPASEVNADPLSGAIWQSVLILQRAIGWRRLEWPLPRLRSLVIRDSAFADEDLATLENLSEFRVLDLEGTAVTNAGLVHLAELRQLEYLVVRRTGVNAAGLQRLQNALRSTWIWN